jgi:hypothetical protein
MIKVVTYYDSYEYINGEWRGYGVGPTEYFDAKTGKKTKLD